MGPVVPEPEIELSRKVAVSQITVLDQSAPPPYGARTSSLS